MRVAERSNQSRTYALEGRRLLTVLVLGIVALSSAASGQSKATTRVAATDVSLTTTADDKAETAAEAEISAMKQQMADQQKQIDKLWFMIEEQRKLLAEARRSSSSEPATAQPESLAVNAAAVTPETRTNTDPISHPIGIQQPPQPLSFQIGSAYITPVGFMDLTAVFRSSNTGSGIGTNFGSIPINNTTAGNLSELRLSAQNSRIGFRVDADVKGAKVLGYFESDFLGPVPGNVAVSSNSDPNRLRLYWVDVRKGKLEFMGGQSWSMLTPNRKGLSPLPGDIFYTQNVDVNYQAGLVWGRQPQFRVIYHPSEKLTLGVSLENPEQYIGGSAGGGLVTLPAALVSSYTSQLSNGNTSLAVPNLMPDIITKAALDTHVGNRSLHFEVAGLIRAFKVYNPLSQKSYSATGGGGSVNLNFALAKNLRFVSNNYYSGGGGRWIFGQAPDLIVRGDGSLSVVNSGSTVTGFETQATKNTQLYSYYGGVYVQRNVAIDPANGNPVGYGYAGSPAGQNRVIHQATFGFTRTFWRDPKYGALQLMGQYSYVIRHPWNVNTGQPTGAHVNMAFLNLRYLLPGSAPTVK